MRQNYFLIVFLLSFFSIHGIFSQEIFNADFSNDGDGFPDHTTSNPPATGPQTTANFGTSPNQWYLSYDTAPNSDTSANSFKVMSGALISSDWGGQGIFTSQPIDISSTSVISISAIGENVGANDNSFKYFYILDGGTRVETEVSPTTNGDPVNYSIINLDVSGSSTLQVGFEFSENGSGDGYSISSFTVSETSDPSVGFDNASSSENETNIPFNTLIPVTFSNYSSDVTIGVNINSSSTAEVSDYTLNTPSLTFTSNATQNISITINDDIDYDSETIILDLVITSGTANITIQQHTITINDDDIPIVINEINADPDVTNGDANGDGTVNTSEDEFVEIYNISGVDLDLSGWILADAVSDRHVFPNTTILPANEAIVIFGGGTPITVPGLVQVASSGILGLNNGGDSVIIKNNSGNVVLTETYGAAGNNQSIARNEDFTGSFIEHSTITSNPVLFSPGRNNTDNTPFSSTIKWTGTTSNDWSTATNWLDNSLPVATSNIVIPSNLTKYPTASSAITFNSLTINNGASFVSQNTVTGTVTYNRNLATNNWYLVSSPVNGETIENLISNNTFDTGTGGNIGIAPYNNNGTAWNYKNISSTGSATSGKGFSVKLATPGDLNFTGTINNNNITYPITQNTTNFNLIGNPFTSYINLGTFLTDNNMALTEQTIWLWNQATGSYDLKMSGIDAAFQIAPGQGFFVSAASNTNITFNASNQSHQTDSFQRTPRTTINLIATKNKVSKSTKLYYIAGTTTGFDNGFDGTMFEGTTDKYTLFTQLVTNNKGKNYAIQSLPSKKMESTIVPIGLTALTGQTIEFSAQSNNLPANIKVYLEDRVNNTLINLSENNYNVTLTSDANNIGQFYLHTSSKVPEVKDINTSLDKISIYNSSHNEITIVGLRTKVKITVYSVLGKEILAQNITSNGVSKVTLPNISSGVYIVTLKTDLAEVSKKIILK
ncbi:lamin tail domain-containing protein [Tenacibaculum sp. FZY0031]|uniref:lamin tail domain-containing protein n=1 Tax=Tenacibaculum sp. FZY0031 TaxID=3116648 RepID=UPI002EA8B072|nr:lamin tail domain-containing protein [Tenacibaculum sp. FZY0031]